MGAQHAPIIDVDLNFLEVARDAGNDPLRSRSHFAVNGQAFDLQVPAVEELYKTGLVTDVACKQPGGKAIG